MTTTTAPPLTECDRCSRDLRGGNYDGVSMVLGNRRLTMCGACLARIAEEASRKANQTLRASDSLWDLHRLRCHF